MLILAIDTSGASGVITVAEAGEGFFRVIESAPIAGGTFSAQLIPTLSALLSRHGLRAAELGGFAAASGPGSFTGLRVGLSAIKGLAEVLNKPIAVVSVLEAMAALAVEKVPRNDPGNRKIAAALDAGRREVFLGIYEADQGILPRRLSEELLSQADLVEKLSSHRPQALVVSDRLIAEAAAAAGLPMEMVSRPGSETVARLGAARLLAGETVTVEALDANYLRRSDAEIFFKGAR